MWYLYLDESGDLGFDFVNKKPSKFFTVTILALRGVENNRKLIKAVKVTLRRKLNPPHKRGRLVSELKGSGTTLEIKKYFYKQAREAKFVLYTINLNKRRVYEDLIKNKPRIYNYIARQVLDQIPFEKANARVELIIDKSKGKREIVEFNEYVRRHLEARLDPKVPLDIYHWLSHEASGLQAVDMFCWGIFEKYEKNKTTWYEMFKEKIEFETKYL
ncbi:DUF3800 domain-containing protein [Candidatus Oleimmundimicrobium sp.]|uniref:DUF3800 domain-containing protein n=1 Tax=Candidatus Oleimmundimicrobium sp. TaxID=3060597 RepID=UPI00271A5E50|nr:DUF3800 domain-containing protein [Candidatus Oleimmundimicrobium sp.]MDO8886180.1 DUF3800 domain-containing protein [Candidatus Oleimmundimicrobium sp.]